MGGEPIFGIKRDSYDVHIQATSGSARLDEVKEALGARTKRIRDVLRPVFAELSLDDRDISIVVAAVEIIIGAKKRVREEALKTQKRRGADED
jgi:hypothetical protein